MVKANDPPQLDTLLQEILKSSKYGEISVELIRYIGMQELGKRRNLKEAVKATRSKLHQITAAYLFQSFQDSDRFQLFQSSDQDTVREVCRQLMSYHVSTRERLPILDQFYTTLRAELPPIHSIIDLACGLNPLAIPWMSLEKDVAYYAYDVHRGMVRFLEQYMQQFPINGHAEVRDVLQACPTQSVDVAFVLKTIPCLEQLDKHAGYQILRTLNARHLIVSFPIHSLGGRQKGMATYYEAHFRELLGNEPWHVKRFEFATELVFIVSK